MSVTADVMFVGHEDAWQNLAILYSFMATCEERSVDPQAWRFTVISIPR